MAEVHDIPVREVVWPSGVMRPFRSGAPREETPDIVALRHEAPGSLTSRKLKLIVMVPAYNEADTIGETVKSLTALRGRLHAAGLTLLVYVVNDGSSDETSERALAAGADRVLHHKINQGLGAAVRTGLVAARAEHAEIIVKFDADLQHDPEDILPLIRPILEDEAEIVYGNRFGRVEYRMPLMRRLGNVVFTRLMSWLTHWSLKDSQPGIFAVHRSYVERFHMPGDYNYTQQILLDAYHKGMRFAHVPVTFRERTSGSSFVSYKYPFKVLPQIFMVLVGIRPLRVFGPLGAVFLLLACMVFAWDLVHWLTGDWHKPATHVNLVLGTSFFGLNTLYFGVMADLIVRYRRH